MSSKVSPARASALSGWDAPSAEGFAAYTSKAESCAEDLIAVGPAAARPLRIYADELERLQLAFDTAKRDAASAEGELDSAERGSPGERDVDEVLGDAKRAMGAAREATLKANERAARATAGSAFPLADRPRPHSTPVRWIPH